MNKWIQLLLKVALVLGIGGICLYAGVFMVTGRHSVTTEDLPVNTVPWLNWEHHEEDIKAQGNNQNNNSVNQNNPQGIFANQINQQFQESYDQISSLKIDCDIAMIKVKPSKDSQVHLSVVTYGNSQATASMDQGILTIQSYCDGSQCNHHAGEIEIRVPANTVLDECDIAIALGDLDIETGTWNNPRIELDLGELDMEHIVLNGGEIELHMGNFDFEGTAYGTIHVSNDMGDVDIAMTNSESAVSYTVESNLGEIKINDQKQNNYGMGGKLESIKEQAECSLSLDVSMGEVELEFFHFDD